MKILVLGKRGSIVRWAEDAVTGFRAAGHEVRFAVTRDPRFSRALDGVLVGPRAALIGRAVGRFRPDLIVAVATYLMPPSILAHIAALPARPPVIGWVGDSFDAAARGVADHLDAVAYTDTGMLAAHRAFGFKAPARYVPHAASLRLVPSGGAAARDDRMVFVANPTPHRRAVVAQVALPLRLLGPGWRPLPDTRHEVQARLVATKELAAIYRGHIAVLNIRNEDNVMAGLNQRHFDPGLAGTPVVSDDQPDIARCFAPGEEVLVYRDPAELNDIYARLRREPDFAARIGENARRRVMAEHLYPQRLQALAAMA